MNEPRVERLRTIFENQSIGCGGTSGSSDAELIALHSFGGFRRWLFGDALVMAQVPNDRDADDSDTFYWAELGSARPADHPELHPEPGTLALSVGRMLAEVHGGRIEPVELRSSTGVRSTGQDPVDYRAPGLIALLESRLEAGLLLSADLPDPYCRYTPTELLDIARKGLAPDGPASSVDVETVALHGWPSASTMAFDLQAPAGLQIQTKSDADRPDGSIPKAKVSLPLSRMWAGRGDAHFDLAIAQRSVQRYFGDEAVFAFYEGYGGDIDIVLLDTYILVSMLMGRSDDV